MEPGYGKFLLMKIGIVPGFGIRNPRIQNPESRILVLLTNTRNPESGIRNPESGIQDCPGLPYMGRQGSQWNPLVREAGDIVKSAGNDLTVTFIESRKFSIAFLK